MTGVWAAASMGVVVLLGAWNVADIWASSSKSTGCVATRPAHTGCCTVVATLSDTRHFAFELGYQRCGPAGTPQPT